MSRLRPHETEFLDAIPHLVAIDAQKLPCMCLVALRALERLDQQLPLDLFEIDATSRQLKLLRAACSPHQAREVARFEPVTIHEQHGALDRVAKLADIPRPSVALQLEHRLRPRSAYALPELTVVPVDVVV